MKNPFGRWLPAIAQNNARSAVLGLAGVAIVGGGIFGPVTAALADPAQPPPRPAVVEQGPGAKSVSYDYIRQPNYYYCGPAATRIALTAIGKAPSQDDVAKRLGTTTDGTNSAAETTRVLNSVSGDNYYKTRTISGKTATAAEMDQLKEDVVHDLGNGRAVVANIAGSATDTAGRVHSYVGGHYLTVVGYTDGGLTVKIADPADTVGDGTYSVPVASLANWIASRGYSA